MPVLKGNITGSVSTIPFDLPCKVVSFFLTSKSSSTITVNMYIVAGGSGSSIAAVPVNLVCISGSIYTSSDEIILPQGYYFIITASGSLDYYISIKPL